MRVWVWCAGGKTSNDFLDETLIFFFFCFHLTFPVQSGKKKKGDFDERDCVNDFSWEIFSILNFL